MRKRTPGAEVTGGKCKKEVGKSPTQPKKSINCAFNIDINGGTERTAMAQHVTRTALSYDMSCFLLDCF